MGGYEEIVMQLKTKDSEVWDKIFKEYRPYMLQVANNVLKNNTEAEDTVQLAFLKAYTNIDNLTPSSNFGSWLSTITRNLAINKTKQNSTRSRLLAAIIDKNPSSPAAIDLYKSIQEEIEKLPDNYKMLVKLRFEQGYKLEEISKNLTMPLGSVKVYLARAVKILRSKFVE